MRYDANTYDLVIVGAGSAGLTAADFANKLGARVAIVEANRIGGDCTWTGCIPSKTLLRTAQLVHEIRTASRFGLTDMAVSIDLANIMAHVRSVVTEIYTEESPEVLRKKGIDVYLGPARFVDRRTLRIGDVEIRGRRFVLCTGAQPVIAELPGAQDAGVDTYETVWNWHRLPERLLVVGAGPVGCELAQASSRLGSRVTLLSSRDRVLPRDEPEAGALLADLLRSEGIQVVVNTRVDNIRRAGGDLVATADEQSWTVDRILLAIGRRPIVGGLGLEQAGVRYTEHGIPVGKTLRTSARHIFAAGDCIGGAQFTHVAAWHGFVAARNALLPGAASAFAIHIPWTTYTDPHIAHVGLSEEQAKARIASGVRATILPLAAIDRSHTERSGPGFIKAVHGRHGRLLGATIVAPAAGEMISEWILALQKRWSARHLQDSLHVYPSYSLGNMQLVAKLREEQLLGGLTGRIARIWVRRSTRG